MEPLNAVHGDWQEEALWQVMSYGVHLTGIVLGLIGIVLGLIGVVLGVLWILQ